MTDLEAKVQTRWTAFAKKWEEKIVEPDSEESTITEMEKFWKERMEKEDKITTNKYETFLWKRGKYLQPT